MRKIYAFDFDGTITNCDSLIAIIRYVSGSRRLLLWILSHLHLLLLMKAGLYSNNKLKQQLCRHIFAGMTEDALAEGSTVCIISASPSIWVRPFFRSCSGIEFLCTEMESSRGVITGRFIGSNCYGQEKVNRLLLHHPDRDTYELTAFGDSRGDRELLAFADYSHYKPFRT